MTDFYDFYDYTTDAGKVRLLISDIDVMEPIFADSAIDAFLDMAGGSVKKAAAQALLSIAVNEILVQKRIRLLDLSTDGPAEAAALRELASEYLSQAADEDPVTIGVAGINWTTGGDCNGTRF